MSGKLSANEFERLISLVWPEIEAELNDWIEQLRALLEDSEDTTTLKDIHQAQGSLRAMRHVLQMPTELLESKRIDEEVEEREKENAREKAIDN